MGRPPAIVGAPTPASHPSIAADPARRRQPGHNPVTTYADPEEDPASASERARGIPSSLDAATENPTGRRRLHQGVARTWAGIRSRPYRGRRGGCRLSSDCVQQVGASITVDLAVLVRLDEIPTILAGDAPGALNVGDAPGVGPSALNVPRGAIDRRWGSAGDIDGVINRSADRFGAGAVETVTS